jgi:hypothetical protein
MDRSSKNYIPPVKMAMAGGVMLNMSTVKSIQVGHNEYYSRYTIIVNYHNAPAEELSVDDIPKCVITSFMEQMS